MFSFCSQHMIQRYEITHARGEAPLVLIFPEGKWESLPFEIRLLRPWYGSAFCDRASLTAQQRLEIAWQGYSVVAQAAGVLSTGKAQRSAAAFPPAAAASATALTFAAHRRLNMEIARFPEPAASGARRAAITKAPCV
jgi:hypothetical protein